jgi:hypothetical protein
MIPFFKKLLRGDDPLKNIAQNFADIPFAKKTKSSNKFAKDK